MHTDFEPAALQRGYRDVLWKQFDSHRLAQFHNPAMELFWLGAYGLRFHVVTNYSRKLVALHVRLPHP